ncbi:FAD-dependent oxidoreductase [Streptomyces achromogenes]|uniref:FAD-dependent oxidoreductase n=1 Tax=Streptomyces achromogenes TaxID=67255 RepID=UPI0037033220
MSRPRVVIVGAGSAGYRAARTLVRRHRNRAGTTLVDPAGCFPYLPPLPQVAAGVPAARGGTVSPRGVRPVPGEAAAAGLGGHIVRRPGPGGHTDGAGYERLAPAVGCAGKPLPVPGVAAHAHGFRGPPEALCPRDRVTRQAEPAAAEPPGAAARCTSRIVRGRPGGAPSAGRTRGTRTGRGRRGERSP